MQLSLTARLNQHNTPLSQPQPVPSPSSLPWHVMTNSANITYVMLSDSRHVCSALSESTVLGCGNSELKGDSPCPHVVFRGEKTNM